jgi:hypothetical protein
VNGIHVVERKDIGCNFYSITTLHAHRIKRRPSWTVMPAHISAVKELRALPVVKSMGNTRAY